MGFPIYLSYTAGYGWTFEEFAYFASGEGFSGIELIPDLHPNLPEEFDQDRIDALSDLRSRYTLQYTVHNIYMDINPTSLVPKVRELALNLTKEVVQFAKAIGAITVVMHTGYRFGPWRTKPEQIEMFEHVQQETYMTLASYSSALGIPILLENGNYYLSGRDGTRQPLHIGIEAEELLAIASIPPGNPFGICLDIGKALRSVDDCSADAVIAYLRKITNLLKEVHINTFDGYQRVIPEILAYLEAINFAGIIVLECARDSIRPLRQLLSSRSM